MRKSDKKTAAERTESVVGSIIHIIAILLAAILIIYSAYVLYDTFYIQAQAASVWDLKGYKPIILDDADAPLANAYAPGMASVNDDYRAWITVDNTIIDYPVFQGEDNLYYATHDAYKNTNLTGSIYLASENDGEFSDSYNLVYGHHMDNSILFGALDSYLSRLYFDEHGTGTIVVADRDVYEIRAFAVARTSAYDEQIYNGGDRMGEVLSYLRSTDETKQLNTLIFDEGALSGASKIVALSTCTDVDTDGRLVVFFAMIPSPGVPVIINPTDVPGTTPSQQQPSAAALPAGTDQSQGGGTATEEIGEATTPLADVFNIFSPRGVGKGIDTWALVNLICLIFTIYLTVPLFNLKGKMGRAKLMNKANTAELELAYGADIPREIPEEEADKLYKIKKFRRKFRTGFVIEIVLSVLALICFILTEDMRLPMILVDKWTPLMLIFLIAVYILDVALVRYREKKADEDTEDAAMPE